MVMGRSFYGGNYTQLYTGTVAFAAAISATPTVFGLTALQAASYQTLSDLYGEKYLAAANVEDRSPAKTQARNDAAGPLRAMARDLASIINGTPTVTNEQKLELGLSVRNVPTPVTELGTPNKFKVALLGNGSLLIKWQCASPRASGMIYEIYRKIAGEADFTYMGGTGEKKWTDSSIPAGTSQITYQIQAVRSTATGGWAQFNVNFGTGGGSGATQPTVTEGEAVKIAA
jgi:hypothetical protein